MVQPKHAFWAWPKVMPGLYHLELTNRNIIIGESPLVKRARKLHSLAPLVTIFAMCRAVLESKSPPTLQVR